MPKTGFEAIPVISVAALQQGASDAIDRVTAEIVDACETAGFFYCVDHGVAPARIEAVFEARR